MADPDGVVLGDLVRGIVDAVAVVGGAGEEHAEGSATAEVDDGAGGGTSSGAAGDGTLGG